MAEEQVPKDTVAATTSVNSNGFKGINTGEALLKAQQAVQAYALEIENYFSKSKKDIRASIAAGFVGEYTSQMDMYVQGIVDAAANTVTKIKEYEGKLDTVRKNYIAEDANAKTSIKNSGVTATTATVK